MLAKGYLGEIQILLRRRPSGQVQRSRRAASAPPDPRSHGPALHRAGAAADPAGRRSAGLPSAGPEHALREKEPGVDARPFQVGVNLVATLRNRIWRTRGIDQHPTSQDFRHSRDISRSDIGRGEPPDRSGNGDDRNNAPVR